MEQKKIRGLLGLAMKAGKLSCGEFSVEKAVRSGNAFLVALAGDASANTKKKFRNMCVYYKVPLCIIAEKEILGQCVGKDIKAVVSVNDENFAAAIQKYAECS